MVEHLDWNTVYEQMHAWIGEQESAGAVWIEPERVIEKMTEVVEAQIRQQRAA